MTEPKPAKAAKPAPAPVVLADAGASSNPLVHQALAELALVEMSGDPAGQVPGIRARLAALGVQ